MLRNIIETFLGQRSCLKYFLALLITGFVGIYHRKLIRRSLKRFFRIQINRLFLMRFISASNPDNDQFANYYRNTLLNTQKVNEQLLERILKSNDSCGIFRDLSKVVRSMAVEQFREEFPLTNYEHYRLYIERMVDGNEKNLLSNDQIIYFCTSSGTTAKTKLLPLPRNYLKKMRTLVAIANAIIWRSLPLSLLPSFKQRSFNLASGKKRESFPRSTTGILIGPLSQVMSAVSTLPGARKIISIMNAISIELVEEVNDFDTNVFMQLVFALAIPDLYAYSVTFAPALIHTIKMMQFYAEEMSECIEYVDFGRSSLVQKHISNMKVRKLLNDALNETISEYGDASYRLERAHVIRKEMSRKEYAGIFHRLWPNLAFVSTAIGGSFTIYKEDIRNYCGNNLPLINLPFYVSSEGFFGLLASIHTDEYLLFPEGAFYEFIKEEDLHQKEPKTYLISEIEPGNQYELVCTTEAGLLRYRTGDVLRCTRYLSRSDDLVPLPTEPKEIPRIPLVSISYRLGNLLDVFGEKTSEWHVQTALQQTLDQIKERNIFLSLFEFTCYPKLNVFPVQYVIFIEVIEKNQNQAGFDGNMFGIIQDILNEQLEVELCNVNHNYKDTRTAQKLGPVICILVEKETFSIFMRRFLINDRVSPTQIKPHHLLKSESHIQFFYDQAICRTI